MNDNLKSIPSYEIQAPELNDVHYAESLRQVFDNINDNFKQLANRDFIKGDTGTSITIQEEPLFINGNPTEYAEAIISCIRNSCEESFQAPIAGLNLFDNFTDEKAGTLKVIYSYDQNSSPVAISSLYYVFLDGRYSNNVIGTIDDALYADSKDLSCIIILEDGIFKILSNTFPTMYYAKGVGLCWKVNGNETGIPVQGIPGRNGIDSKLLLVKSDSVPENNKVSIDYIFSNNAYISTAEYLSIYNLEENVDYTALIICPETTDSTKSNFYFGTVQYDGSKVDGVCNTDLPINAVLQTEEIINAFRTMDLSSNVKLPGIFMPIEPKTENNTQKVHLLSATTVSNIKDDTELNTDILLTPVNDINAVSAGISNENKNLNVDKYLYIKVTDDTSTLVNLCDGFDSAAYTVLRAFLSKYNYILKYKLVETVKNLDNKERFNFIVPSGNPSIDLEQAAVMPLIGFSNDVNTAKSEICFYDNTNENYITSENYKTCIPELFKTTAEKTGIYLWQLCFDYNDFDPDELKICKSEFNNYTVDDNVSTSSCVTLFNSLFTLTMSPTLTSEIMWFNGMTRDKDSNENYIQKIIENNVETTYTALTGWNYDNTDLLHIYKYTPVYKNDFKIDDDTVFNINYNVNITGDDAVSKKNLTVNGGINCEDLHVYNLAAAGEIKNIYTKDDIISEKGIILGYSKDNTDDSHSMTTVISEGELITNKVTTNNIDSNLIESTTLKNPFVQITVDENNWPLKDSDSQLIVKYEGGIIAKDVNKIFILRPDGPETVKYTQDQFENNTPDNEPDVEHGDYVEPITPLSTRAVNKEEAERNPDKLVIMGSNPDVGGGGMSGVSGGSSIVVGGSDNLIGKEEFDEDNTGGGFDINDIPTIPSNPDVTPEEDEENSSQIEYISPTGKTIIDIANYQPVLTTTIPVNSNNETPVIVSNTDMNSQQLCAAGIAKNYFDGVTEQPFDPSSDNVDFVRYVNFDNVKDFNIHRLSLNALTTINTVKSDIVPLDDMYSINALSDIKTDIIDTYRQCYYQIHQSGNAQKEFTYKFNPVDIPSFENNNNYKTANKTIINNGFVTFGANGIYKKYIHKVDISRKSDADMIDRSTPIEIKLNKVYNTLIALLGKTSNGDNAVLVAGTEKNPESFIKVRLAYTINDGVLTYVPGIDKTLRIVSANKKWTTGYSKKASWKDDSAIFVKNDKNTEFKTEDNLLKLSGTTFSGTYNWRWRFRSFNFLLNTFKININNSEYTKICEAYDAGKTVSFYILPEFQLHVKCEDSKKLVSGAYTTIPVPVHGVAKNISTSELTAVDSTDKQYGYYTGTTGNDELYCSYKYYYSQGETANDIKSTTIANNGIVFRDDKYTFGLGYSNEPVLFYHKFDNNDYNVSDGVITAKSDYNSRTKSIPLSKLFKLVETIESIEDRISVLEQKHNSTL